MSVLHVNWSRAEHRPDVQADEREPARWCFHCRKRLPGTHKFYADPPGSYYDPFWKYECDGCGKDRRWFPGCGPV
jgi:hypothetical protein